MTIDNCTRKMIKGRADMKIFKNLFGRKRAEKKRKDEDFERRLSYMARDGRVFDCTDCPYRIRSMNFCGFCMQMILDDAKKEGTLN